FDGLGGLRVRRPVETNIVLVDTSGSAYTPMELVGTLIGAGIRGLPLNATTVRLVTHLDVSRSDVEHAIATARNIVPSKVTPSS
ncbi:MAG: threonine aldolase, partial [Candidatus Binatia bacterium]